MNSTLSSRPYLRMIEILAETIPFLVKNKLWSGFFKQKTVLFFTVFLGLTIPVAFFNFLTDNSTAQGKINKATMGFNADFLQNINFLSGTQKYLIMILFSMLITYFMHKTLDKLAGYQGKITLTDYVNSQVRIILVSVRNWFYELIIGIGVSVGVGIFGPDWMEDVVKFFVGAFFTGYLFFDSYYSMFDVKIKEVSFKIKEHIPAAVVLGTCVKLIFAIPFLGAIAGSVIGAIAVTWYMQTTDSKVRVESFV